MIKKTLIFCHLHKFAKQFISKAKSQPTDIDVIEFSLAWCCPNISTAYQLTHIQINKHIAEELIFATFISVSFLIRLVFAFHSKLFVLVFIICTTLKSGSSGIPELESFLSCILYQQPYLIFIAFVTHFYDEMFIKLIWVRLIFKVFAQLIVRHRCDKLYSIWNQIVYSST